MKKKNGIIPPSKKCDPSPEEIALKELAELAKTADKTAGINMPWNIDHLPHGACLSFNKASQIQEKFGAHVSKCEYCKKRVEIAAEKPYNH